MSKKISGANRPITAYSIRTVGTCLFWAAVSSLFSWMFFYLGEQSSGNCVAWPALGTLLIIVTMISLALVVQVLMGLGEED